MSSVSVCHASGSAVRGLSTVPPYLKTILSYVATALGPFPISQMLKNLVRRIIHHINSLHPYCLGQHAASEYATPPWAPTVIRLPS